MHRYVNLPNGDCLSRDKDGFWWCWSRYIYGYTLPNQMPMLVTKSKDEARAWKRRSLKYRKA